MTGIRVWNKRGEVIGTLWQHLPEDEVHATIEEETSLGAALYDWSGDWDPAKPDWSECSEYAIVARPADEARMGRNRRKAVAGSRRKRTTMKWQIVTRNDAMGATGQVPWESDTIGDNPPRTKRECLDDVRAFRRGECGPEMAEFFADDSNYMIVAAPCS